MPVLSKEQSLPNNTGLGLGFLGPLGFLRVIVHWFVAEEQCWIKALSRGEFIFKSHIP